MQGIRITVVAPFCNWFYGWLAPGMHACWQIANHIRAILSTHICVLSSNPADSTSCTLMSCQFACIFVTDDLNKEIWGRTRKRINRFLYVLSHGHVCFCDKCFIFELFHKYRPINQPERGVLRSQDLSIRCSAWLNVIYREETWLIPPS